MNELINEWIRMNERKNEWMNSLNEYARAPSTQNVNFQNEKNLHHDNLNVYWISFERIRFEILVLLYCLVYFLLFKHNSDCYHSDGFQRYPIW